MRAHTTVLALQDTTYFDFAHRLKTDGLDIVKRSKANEPIDGLMLLHIPAQREQSFWANVNADSGST